MCDFITIFYAFPLSYFFLGYCVTIFTAKKNLLQAFFFFFSEYFLFLFNMVHNIDLDSPNEEGVHDFDNSPYFDYHQLKAIENVKKEKGKKKDLKFFFFL